MLRNIAIGFIATLLSFQVFAKDDLLMFDVEAALNTPAAQQKLNKGVSFYFGESKHPRIKKELGATRTNKKTNGFTKNATDSCQWVFLSAMMSLQNAAVKQGGNAVIDIKSNFKGNEINHDSQFQCGKGFIMASVAFTGIIVSLDK